MDGDLTDLMKKIGTEIRKGVYIFDEEKAINIMIQVQRAVTTSKKIILSFGISSQTTSFTDKLERALTM